MITLFEGFKSKMDKQIELNKKINLYTPGSFIIVCLDRWSTFIRDVGPVLLLLKIISYEKVQTYDVKHYIKIQILDYISLDKQDIDIDTVTSMDIENDKTQMLFKSNSKVSAINKFEELKEEYPYKNWIIKNDMEKYNI